MSNKVGAYIAVDEKIKLVEKVTKDIKRTKENNNGKIVDLGGFSIDIKNGIVSDNSGDIKVNLSEMNDKDGLERSFERREEGLYYKEGEHSYKMIDPADYQKQFNNSPEYSQSKVDKVYKVQVDLEIPIRNVLPNGDVESIYTKVKKGEYIVVCPHGEIITKKEGKIDFSKRPSEIQKRVHNKGQSSMNFHNEQKKDLEKVQYLVKAGFLGKEEVVLTESNGRKVVTLDKPVALVASRGEIQKGLYHHLVGVGDDAYIVYKDVVEGTMKEENPNIKNAMRNMEIPANSLLDQNSLRRLIAPLLVKRCKDFNVLKSNLNAQSGNSTSTFKVSNEELLQEENIRDIISKEFTDTYYFLIDKNFESGSESKTPISYTIKKIPYKDPKSALNLGLLSTGTSSSFDERGLEELLEKFLIKGVEIKNVKMKSRFSRLLQEKAREYGIYIKSQMGDERDQDRRVTIDYNKEYQKPNTSGRGGELMAK